MEPNYLTAQPVELCGAPSSSLLLKSVYALYSGQFRRWFGITAPLSLLASVTLWMADDRIRAIYRNIPRGELAYHPGVIAEAFALRFGAFFSSWLLGCIVLAAIATVVNGLEADDTNDVWRSDSYQKAREHFGALLSVALLTFCVFLAGMAVIELVEVALAKAVVWSNFSRFSFIAGLIGYVLIAGIVSWFGTAIPLILSGDATPRSALKKSLRLSNGYEAFLFLLVVESTAGSWLAYYAVRSGLQLLFPAALRHTSWYGWVVYFAAILASAAVEPPMFIGFSLLAANERASAVG